MMAVRNRERRDIGTVNSENDSRTFPRPRKCPRQPRPKHGSDGSGPDLPAFRIKPSVEDRPAGAWRLPLLSAYAPALRRPGNQFGAEPAAARPLPGRRGGLGGAV